jgi:hypothetical protein
VPFPSNRMRISSAIHDRDLEVKMGQCLGKLIDKHILPTGVWKARDNPPLVDTVVGDHQHVFPGGGKKGFVHLLGVDG